MKCLTDERFKKIAYSICYDYSLREDFYQHCILEALSSNNIIKANEEGYLLQYFTTICKNQMYNKNSNFNKLYNFKTNELSENLTSNEDEEDTLNQRILESDLQRHNTDEEAYIKKIVKIYIREGSIRQASISTGINRKTITDIIDTYVRNFNRNSTIDSF